MLAKQKGEKALSHKEDLSVLQSYLKEILPDVDEERVYPSDIKKIFQWYNLLLSYGILEFKEEKPKKETKEKASEDTEKKPTAKKKPAPKKKPEAKKTK